MHYKSFFAAVLFSLFLLPLSSCDTLLNMLSAGIEDNTLSNTEIVQGLKEALNTGADKSSDALHATDGYFKDPAVKISLPPEAKVITDNIRRIPGLGDKALEELELRLNRAAEDAADEAKPIILNAVRNMTIKDGLNILKGKTPGKAEFDSTAATAYLKRQTYQQLYNAFQPKIDASLDKKIVAGVSANEAWEEITGLYNKVAPLLGKAKVNSSLSAYVTERALNGLFIKIGEEEKKIRQEPYKYAKEIIRKVFGSMKK